MDKVTDEQSVKKWYLWVSDRTSDKPLICKTGGGSMIGYNEKAIRKLQKVTTELVTIWDGRIQYKTDDN